MFLLILNLHSLHSIKSKSFSKNITVNHRQLCAENSTVDHRKKSAQLIAPPIFNYFCIRTMSPSITETGLCNQPRHRSFEYCCIQTMPLSITETNLLKGSGRGRCSSSKRWQCARSLARCGVRADLLICVYTHVRGTYCNVFTKLAALLLKIRLLVCTP